MAPTLIFDTQVIPYNAQNAVSGNGIEQNCCKYLQTNGCNKAQIKISKALLKELRMAY